MVREEIVATAWRHAETIVQGRLFTTLDKFRAKISSEIPCRVSSDPHERLNDLVTVLRMDSAKLQWL